MDTEASAATGPGEAPVPPLVYQLKVTVDDDLRQELRLSGRERRGRVFLAGDAPAVIGPDGDHGGALAALRRELHGFFRALRKDTYRLAAGLPLVEPDGTLLPGDPAEAWPIDSDVDVAETFRRAREHFEATTVATTTDAPPLKRPSLVLFVRRDPAAPGPPPPPAYLEGLPDPGASPTISMVSFYSFPPGGVADPEEFALRLRRAFRPFQARGRIYVAPEGINAQMSVPTTGLPQFRLCCDAVPELGGYMENGINVDPIPLPRADFEAAPPFTGLHVRVRDKIVADGLDRPLEWRCAGYDMPPLEWHDRLKRARDRARHQQRGETGAATGDSDEPLPIVLDFRNTYETEVGRFELAEPLGTTNFRDSWDVVNERLADVPKDTPIMMYCTGGIRCVKAGAYVTQELGFTNVARLAGGIIAYDRTLKEQAETEESMFKGTNFVFDGRLSRQITDDALGVCLTCGGETSLVSNCRNDNCHKRMIQCQECRTSMMGACSDACRNRVVNGQMQPRRISADVATDATSQIPVAYDNLDQYSQGHSTPPPSIYAELALNSRALIPSGSHMVSGGAQGRLLAQLAALTREGRVLEMGTFTGYATACLLEGALNVGRLYGQDQQGSRASGPYVLSMERDSVAFEVAVAHMRLVAEHGFGETAADKLAELRAQGTVAPADESIVSLDCEGVAVCELMRVSDALAMVEEMAAGRGQFLPGPFDLIFVDADKTRLVEYAEACLSSDRLLKRGGLLVVDNVLWKGLVLEASTGNFASLRETEETDDSEVRRNRRARKLAMKMHRFNSAIVQDSRAEVLVLPVRDGLSIIRKK